MGIEPTTFGAIRQGKRRQRASQACLRATGGYTPRMSERAEYQRQPGSMITALYRALAQVKRRSSLLHRMCAFTDRRIDQRTAGPPSAARAGRRTALRASRRPQDQRTLRGRPRERSSQPAARERVSTALALTATCSSPNRSIAIVSRRRSTRPLTRAFAQAIRSMRSGLKRKRAQRCMRPAESEKHGGAVAGWRGSMWARGAAPGRFPARLRPWFWRVRRHGRGRMLIAWERGVLALAVRPAASTYRIASSSVDGAAAECRRSRGLGVSRRRAES
jgi:hypothetical protein